MVQDFPQRDQLYTMISPFFSQDRMDALLKQANSTRTL
jgi:hypothetical protein